MPITRLGSTTTDDLITDEVIAKICEKLQSTLTPIIENIVENKCTAILNSVNAISKLVQDNKTCFEKYDKRLDELEQYSRRNNLRIFGIEEKAGEDTDQSIINFVQQKLSLTISINEIDRSHRVGLSRNGKPRAILVKFVSYRCRAEVFKRKKLLKNSPISIKEDLTIYRSNVLREAVKKFGVANVWSNDGRIFIKQGVRKFKITSMAEFPDATAFPVATN